MLTVKTGNKLSSITSEGKAIGALEQNFYVVHSELGNLVRLHLEVNHDASGFACILISMKPDMGKRAYVYHI